MGFHTTEVVMKFTDQFTSGFEKSIRQIQNGTLISKKAIRDLNTAGTTMLRAGTTMFIPLAAGIRQALASEIEYENAVAKVKTLANENEKSIDVIGKEMRDISKTYGEDISSVADTFYDVISATVDTANAIDYVKVASNMAVGGFADMKTAVTGLTSAMAAYKGMGYDMYRIGDILAQTQVYGKTTINELSESLGQVVPYTSAVHMSFEDLGTAMAVLTSNGLDTSMAAITLKNAMNSILKPSSEARKAFESLGVTYGSNAFKDLTFGEYLNHIKEAIGLSEKAKEQFNELTLDENTTDEELTEFYRKAGVNVDKLLTMFKNIRGATAMISLTNSIEKFERFRTQMNPENSTGVLEKQTEIMLSAPERQFKILRENFNDSLRQFGVKLMPKLNEFLGYANDILKKLNGMSDEQISKIVDNVLKIAGASAGLIALGAIAKSVASILTLVNLIWKPISTLLGGKAIAETGAAAGTAAGTAAGVAKSVLNPVTATVAGVAIGNKLSMTEIGDDSLSRKYGKNGELFYEDLERIGNEEREKTVINNSKVTNNTYNKTEERQVAYERFDPNTNKFTTVYIDSVNVSGVEDLDGIINEVENAADNMK